MPGWGKEAVGPFDAPVVNTDVHSLHDEVDNEYKHIQHLRIQKETRRKTILGLENFFCELKFCSYKESIVGEVLYKGWGENKLVSRKRQMVCI